MEYNININDIFKGVNCFLFDIHNIKKFYKLTKPIKYNSDIFVVVAGYDFINNFYIVSPLNDRGGVYNVVKSSDEQFYTFNEAIEYIDFLIKNETDKLDVINSLKFLSADKIQKENSKNECMHLFSAFKETYEQIKYLNIYLNGAIEAKDKKQIKLYGHEIAKTHKAIKRLKKRFYYYFENKSEEVQDLVLKQNYLCNIASSMYYIKKNIEKLEEQKQKLIKWHNNN